jgi:NADH-quinone oxidoreductase subunit N
MAIFMLSLAGLPPLAGFFGKFYLFSAALRSCESHGLLWLVALALFGSLISLYYYLVVLKAIFLEESAAVVDHAPVGALQRMTIGVLAAIVFGLGVMPAVLLNRILAALP